MDQLDIISTSFHNKKEQYRLSDISSMLLSFKDNSDKKWLLTDYPNTLLSTLYKKLEKQKLIHCTHRDTWPCSNCVVKRKKIWENIISSKTIKKQVPCAIHLRTGDILTYNRNFFSKYYTSPEKYEKLIEHLYKRGITDIIIVTGIHTTTHDKRLQETLQKTKKYITDIKNIFENDFGVKIQTSTPDNDFLTLIHASLVIVNESGFGCLVKKWAKYDSLCITSI